jgi:hypothetical protein
MNWTMPYLGNSDKTLCVGTAVAFGFSLRHNDLRCVCQTSLLRFNARAIRIVVANSFESLRHANSVPAFFPLPPMAHGLRAPEGSPCPVTANLKNRPNG